MNSQAVGATIKIFSGQRVQSRVLTRTNGGQSSQVERGAFFAIPKDELLDKFVIFWPYRDSNRKPIKVTIKNLNKYNTDYNNMKICFPDKVVSIEQKCD
jgi:hypothetical protein